MMSPLLKTQLKLHALVFLLGFTGILGALTSIPSTSLTWYRMLIAFFGLLGYLILTNRPLKLTLRPLISIMANGLLIAAHWILFFESIKVSTVSVALACFSSTSLFTAMIEPLLFRKKVVKHELVLGVLVIIGLSIIFQFETQYTLGIVYGLISAFLAASFSVINALFIKKHRANVISLYEMLGGFLGITLFFIITSQLSFDALSLSPFPEFGAGIGGFVFSTELNIICLLILGLACSSYAFVQTVEVMKVLSPFTVNLTFNLEPIYAIILALICFGEREQMSAEFYLGVTLILCTVFANAILKKKNSKV